MRRDHLLIIASIAVGTALLACMLSSTFAVLIDPLPFPQANRITTVKTIDGGSPVSSSSPDYHDLSKSGGPLQDSVYVRYFNASAEIGGHPESVYSVSFEGNLFTVFQKAPVLGSPSDLDSTQPRNTPAAILSYPAWVKFFGRDPQVLGKLIHIGSGAYEVSAVLPPEYQLALDADIWVTAQNTAKANRANRDGRIFARLASGASVASANAYLGTIASSLQAQAPDTNEGITFQLGLLRDSLAGESKLLLYLLALGAIMVLCVAYFNAYQLLAAKAQTVIMRWRICLALGASRKRLFRDMLKEPLLLTVISCSLGLLLSLLGMQVLRAFSPTDIPRIADSRLVWQVGLVAFVFSILAAVVFTLLMLIRILSLEAGGALHGGSHNGASIHHAFQVKRQSLLMIQIALSATLLISIGMIAAALYKATYSSLGLSADGISVTDLSLKQPTNTLAGATYVSQMARSVAVLPGVENVAVTSSAPFQGRSYNNTFSTSETGPEGKQLQYAAISPEFFAVLQTNVLHGRTFTDSDNSDSAKVAILNQAAAQTLFGNGESLHQSVHAGSDANAATMEVVGVVENIRQDPTTVVAPPIVYLPLAQTKTYAVSFVVRAKVPITNADVKPRVWAINANQAVGETALLVDLIDASLRRIRFMAFLMMLFAGVTMVLSALGIYAAVAQWLSTSQREIALHLALGATYYQIRNSILARIMAITGMALAVGLLAALAIRNTLKTFLYGVQPQMSTVIAFAALLLASVALLSSYIPALRSKFIDPARLLRSE
ncbi:MAG TPA: ABC transporter permease [Candidatus Angelobacter sp.]|nr:ABC transporter permease [Candidatus Angelobacter sp.]